MLRAPLLAIAPALLVLTSEVSAYSPKPPPIPRSCKSACQGKDLGCVERCAADFANKPWRERLALEEARGRTCLEQERACRAQQSTRCMAPLVSCVWRALGLSAARMPRCWAAHRQTASRCRRHEGKGGWSCRNVAFVALDGCRKRALGRRALDDDGYRVLAAMEEALGLEAAAP